MTSRAVPGHLSVPIGVVMVEDVGLSILPTGGSLKVPSVGADIGIAVESPLIGAPTFEHVPATP